MLAMRPLRESAAPLAAKGVDLDNGRGMKRVFLILLGVAAALVAVWELWLSPSWTIRYRLTLDVAVGDEVKSGSSVIEVTFESTWLNPEALGPWWPTVKGEAVAVDLGSRGVLFTLLVADETRASGSDGSDPPPSFLVDAFYGRVGQGNATRQMLSEVKSRRDVVEAPPGLLPMLVRFRDINDPKSVERVDPDDLAKSFGTDVKLVRVTAQIVPTGIWPFNWLSGASPRWLFGEPVTMGIENTLPWLDKRNPGKWLVEPHGEAASQATPEKRLTYSAFIRGIGIDDAK
jgi:hypothetical protein